jgi:hemoglobin
VADRSWRVGAVPRTETMFERYGGFAKVSRIVSSFYDRVLDSPLLAPYFHGIEMRRLIDHQTKFMVSVMGGPASYTDEHLSRVHAHLGIDDAAFNEVAALLRETLEDHDYDEGDIAVVIGEIVRRRPLIVARTQPSVAAVADA